MNDDNRTFEKRIEDLEIEVSKLRMTLIELVRATGGPSKVEAILGIQRGHASGLRAHDYAIKEGNPK
jgi:hypothetical protein